MSAPPYRALFLCTGNSARSVLAEATLQHLGQGRVLAYSAGSRPLGRINPFAIELLQRQGIATEGLRSKSWDEFAAPGAPKMDFIFTVCDSAAGETCPVWPGHPATAHWGVPDPAAVTGSDADKRHAFVQAYTVLRRRIELFLSLPLDRLEHLALASKLRDIGHA
ncbi:MAG: arsenate reductase ArsC [Gammaproteobacteria bacterium]